MKSKSLVLYPDLEKGVRKFQKPCEMLVHSIIIKVILISTKLINYRTFKQLDYQWTVIFKMNETEEANYSIVSSLMKYQRCKLVSVVFILQRSWFHDGTPSAYHRLYDLCVLGTVWKHYRNMDNLQIQVIHFCKSSQYLRT